MKQRNRFHREIFRLQNDAGLSLHETYLIVDIHIQKTPVGIDVIAELFRTVDVQRFIAVDLGGKHQQSGQARYMVRMHVADEDVFDAFPVQVEHLEAYLSALSAVEEHEVPVVPHHRRGEESSGKRLHSAGSENKNFKTHD